MVAWNDYKAIAKDRGALALELYIVESTPQRAPDDVKQCLPAHLEYQRELEQRGILVLAGPLSDPTGESMEGAGPDRLQGRQHGGCEATRRRRSHAQSRRAWLHVAQVAGERGQRFLERWPVHRKGAVQLMNAGMLATATLGDLLSTLLDRRPFGRKFEDGRDIKEICLALLTETDESSSRQLADTILNRYRVLDRDRKIAFFEFLNDELDLDAARIAELAETYGSDPSPGNFKALSKAAEPQRQALFRQLNEAPGATAEIVRMRRDLLTSLEERPELARTDHDIVHLLRSWFNRGFLVMRQINWESPASILEKIIAYEAVHEIGTWDDLRRRLQPVDRRCFAFFHPAMPHEPLIFVEVALTSGVPKSIQSVLSNEREAMDAEDADTAVFYSISNCQTGLAGVSFGNSLIKQVVRDLSHDLPNIRAFVTLSPIPGLMRWLKNEGTPQSGDNPQRMERLAAKYLLDAKAPDGLPLDPVARFHLGNGATVHAIHSDADLSESRLVQSSGVMVNYRYDLSRIAQNTIQFSKRREVVATTSVKNLAKRAAVAS